MVVVMEATESGALLVIRIIRADLLRSFYAFGKMDPFAIVKWVAAEDSQREVSMTPTHWSGHMSEALLG